VYKVLLNVSTGMRVIVVVVVVVVIGGGGGRGSQVYLPKHAGVTCICNKLE
jgi:hypothetical protein